jgi:DNA-binding beta-propeller fold protein YncE
MKYPLLLSGWALLAVALGNVPAQAAAPAAPAATPPSKIDWNIEKTWELPAKPLDISYSLDEKLVFILTDQHTVLIYNNTGELTGSIPVDKGVSAIDIAPRGEKLYLINGETKSFSDLTIDFVADINTAGSPFRGQANAPVTIAVFTDFQ